MANLSHKEYFYVYKKWPKITYITLMMGMKNPY